MKNLLNFSFLFYDYETFGKNPVLDKPAQFACVRTDINLKIISKPFVFYCYPSIDYFPDPEAVLITSITPQYTRIHGMNESNFSKKIYDIFIQSNTCILGFNNILFDDEITRNLFYRNFFDSYEWSWKKNNTRWDVINVIRAFYALRPEGIVWPKNKNNCVSFKLFDLVKKNKINYYSSHDALSDVYSTINLLKLVRNNNEKFFNFLFLIRKKKKLLLLINKRKMKPLIYISHYYGSKNKNIGRIFPLIFHKKNKNILIVFDLDRDYSSNFFLKNYYKFGNLNYLFSEGMRFIYLNKAPIILPTNVLRDIDISRLKLNEKRYLNNINLLKNFFNLKRRKKLSMLKFKKKKFLHSDCKLYKNFFSFKDIKKIKILRKLINLKNINNNIFIDDKRFKDLFFFFKARNYPNFLNKTEKIKWIKYLKNIFSKKNIKNYKKKIFILKEKNKNNLKKNKLLNKLLLYIKYIKNIYNNFN